MTDQISRLEFDELEEGLAEVLAPRYERLGYLGEFFKCMGHQPRALRAFVAFTEAAKDALPGRLAELIALTVASKLGNDYERNQHERLSLRLGFGREWVAAVEHLNPEGSAALDGTERAVQRYVLDALGRHGHGTADALGQVVAAIGQQQAVAALMVMGRYVAHALVVNSLCIAPPVPSIFEDGFDG